MSLARLALRFVTVQILKDRTMADDRVRDSSIVSLEDALSDAPAPIILVYTDDAESSPEGKSLWGGDGLISLVIIVAVAGMASTTIQNEDGENVVTRDFTFPATDASIERSIDLIERQIKTAIADPANEWAEVWRGLVVGIQKIKSGRGASTKEGVRFGARQIEMMLDAVGDPVPGAPLVGYWKKLVDLCAAGDADQKAFGTVIEAFLRGAPHASWERDQMQFGLTRIGLRGVGLDPVSFHAMTGTEPAELIHVEIEGMGLVSEADEGEA